MTPSRPPRDRADFAIMALGALVLGAFAAAIVAGVVVASQLIVGG